MFLAPCTLPIVPGYLAFIGGVPEGSSGDAASRRCILTNELAFVSGCSLIFILLGVFAGLIGMTLGVWRYDLARAAGAILILFGLTMLPFGRIPVLSGEFRFPVPRWLSLGRWESSLMVGALFALGWSPCIGPILGSILFLASSSATAGAGAILLAVFSLGLGLPFLAVAFGITAASARLQRLTRISPWLHGLGGLVLIAVGAMILFNMSGLLVSWSYGVLGFLQYDRLLNYL